MQVPVINSELKIMQDMRHADLNGKNEDYCLLEYDTM
jgi:hypothetical protein